ncbi:hypothetical protein F5148DRAFT_1371750 [Russula earlei]|uniref:Uncharacterized protein n=1 Tax=Russula earlei TaxID=71964 RepID=A0ACC0TUE2_9AGAM|nr:hypothetical protein F5148DRAFT_1371750 [Russula earlei]
MSTEETGWNARGARAIATTGPLGCQQGKEERIQSSKNRSKTTSAEASDETRPFRVVPDLSSEGTSVESFLPVWAVETAGGGGGEEAGEVESNRVGGLEQGSSAVFVQFGKEEASEFGEHKSERKHSEAEWRAVAEDTTNWRSKFKSYW